MERRTHPVVRPGGGRWRAARWLLRACLLLLAVGAAVPAVAGPLSAPVPGPPITVPFDHLTTGFELEGIHRQLPCEACHLNAVFYGTPRDCASCHTEGSQFNATPKNRQHIPSSNNCAACHNTISFRPAFHFDHAQVLGACVSCHNGTIAQGEGSAHPPTSQNCVACHAVTTWNPAKAVDHSQIPLAVSGRCIVCHNGTTAAGKNPGHISTSLECGDCHTTSTWLGSNFNHTGITSGCFSCHNGVKAVGKSAAHMPTTNLCESCHTTGLGTPTPSWVPSLFLHTQMSVNTCASCHSGQVKISTGVVSGMPANHVPPIPALVDCSVCHGNNPASETWAVLAATIPQLHAGLSVNDCLMCHAGQSFAGVPAPYTPMTVAGISPTKKTALSPPHIPILGGADCSACHAAAYQAGGFGPATAMTAAKHAYVSKTCDTCHDTGRSFYTGGGTALQLRPADHLSSANSAMATGDCSGCHTTTNWNSTALPAGHMPNPANQVCTVCHIGLPTTYLTLAANPVLHTGITGNCGQCHGSRSAALTWYNNYTPKDAILTPQHIPYLTGTDCASCHAPSSYALGGFGPMNMTQAKHAFVPTTCNTCHEAGLSFYMGAASPALQGRPADHTSGLMVAPNDCSLCHTTANWNSTALPAGHMPNPANQGCTVCHTKAPTDYTPATLAATPVLHTGISGGCAQCHGGTTPLTWYNNFTPKDGVLTPAHIPYLSGTDCSSCHAPSTYAVGGFGPMNMTQAKHAYVATTCITCHEAGRSFYMGAANPGLQGRPADHNSGQMAAPNDCSICHTTANWNSTALPAGHMPNPANQGCTTCHTAAPTDYSPATLAANPVLHTGINSGCLTCHGSPAGALTFYNNFSPKSAVLAPVHIPTGNTPCEDCHNPAGFTSFAGTTMSASKHALMFGYIGGTCDACHNRVNPPLNFYGVGNLTTRPTDHNSGSKATADCNQCHNPNDWGGDAQARAAKSATTGTPTTRPGTTAANALHAGTTADAGSSARILSAVPVTPAVAALTGKPLPTVPSAIVHTAGSPAMPVAVGAGAPIAARGAFSHAGVSAACASCHDGVHAAGKGAGHIASNASCGNCHTTNAWLPARFDHSGVRANCASCHNGVTAPGRPVAHVTTLLACGACHSTLSWRPVHYLHAGAVGACQSCHNAAAGLGKPAGHPATTQDCAACHGTQAWLPLLSTPQPKATPPAQAPAQRRPGGAGR